MTWTTHHRRSDVLRDVIATADLRRDGLLPMELSGVRETFGDELTLLGALQLRWHTRLAGRIEREIMRHPDEQEAAALDAWRQTAGDLPGVHAIIDHYTQHPLDDAMARATRVAAAKERVLLGGRCGTLVA
jgi:hypothetical protein